MAQSTSSTGNQPLIELRHVDKHYGDLHVLNDINLSVDRGEVVVVIGPSMRISPESMVSRRLMVRHMVDLPEPEGPITTTTSPRSTERLMSLRTCRSP